MKFPDINTLNETFGIPEHLVFTEGPGKLPLANLTGKHGRVSVGLHGAHVMEYQPHDQPPVLWLSPMSRHESGKAIRGGIPLCWPWFSGHPTDPAKPAHGLARTALWQVAGSEITTAGAVVIGFTLSDSAATRSLWPHSFTWDVRVCLDVALTVELSVRNLEVTPVTCSGALHSYFHVSDIRRIKITGLENCHYVDLLDGQRKKQQTGSLTFTGETDRVYGPTSAACVIDDPLWQRRISIAKMGSNSTVVWNPWREKSQRMADMPMGGYFTMVCVETTNAVPDVITLAPGAEHRLAAIIKCQPY